MPPAVLFLAVPILLAAGADYVFPALGEWVYSACVLIVADPGTAVPQQPLGPWAPYLLHILVHYGFFHIAMNMAVLISAGRVVGMAFGTGVRGSAGFLILFCACSIAGAATQVLLHSGDTILLGGASTGVSGLIAAAGWVTGGWRGMARLALPWIALNIVLAFAEMAMPIPMSWAGHIGGTVAGIVLTPILLGLFSEREF
nr:rhomboid family intramembrane serine protease [Maricaulis parjimensis]